MALLQTRLTPNPTLFPHVWSLSRQDVKTQELGLRRRADLAVLSVLSVFQVIRVGLLCHDPCNFHLAKACSSALATFLWSGVGWYDRNRMEQVCVFVLDWRVERRPRDFQMVRWKWKKLVTKELRKVWNVVYLLGAGMPAAAPVICIHEPFHWNRVRANDEESQVTMGTVDVDMFQRGL